MLGTIGFDLDLTLVDSRPGIERALRALSATRGVPIAIDVVLGRIGPKLETELANWFPDEEVADAARHYRALYFDTCVDGGTIALPGASEALAAVHEADGRVLVVTAKSAPLAERCLEYVSLSYDALVGNVFGAEKCDALREHDARVYVGDTLTDVASAHAAGATAVAVTTGPDDAETLARAGASYVFASLHDVAAWLRTAAALRGHVNHVNRAVAMQNAFARTCELTEEVELAVLVEEAVALGCPDAELRGLTITREVESAPPVAIDRHRVLQIAVNLIANARDSVTERRCRLEGADAPPGRSRCAVGATGSAAVRVRGALREVGAVVSRDPRANLSASG